MGPAYFVIAILGCADGSQACTRVATMPAHYADRQSCAMSAARALEANADFDFPTLIAECQPMARRTAASREGRPPAIPADARRS
ncbi:MAG TPA: hypothetical protein VFK50_06950 [Sphingomicrobium sp.]|nr:hypothetical protein [Sphingomicrobium sp.]